MIAFLVKRPVGVIITFVALTLLGLVAGRLVPTSLLPDTDIPQIAVYVDAGELSAREVESNITTRLRESLQQTRHLENVESTSENGVARIQLRFTHGTDMSMAFIAVNEKIDMLMNQLPKDIERPQVTRSSIADIPVFHVQVWDRSGQESPARLAEIGSFAKEVLRRRIEQLPEISMVDLSGYAESQIMVSPRIDRLKTLGLTPTDLVSVFKDNRVELGTIQISDGHYRYYLRFVSELDNIDQLANIPIRVGDRIFQLDELVDISADVIPPKGFFYSKEHRAIDIAVIKRTDAKVADLQESFRDLLVRFEQDYPDLRFHITQDQTSLLDFAIGNLRQDLVVGGILAFICMLIFIRKWRAALLVGITIPVTLILAQIGFYLFGISFNIISLGGLILGLGMIIDNSIVVIDTITLHQRKGIGLEEAVVAGPTEILTPLFSSVLTNCAVFVPLLFLSGLAGAIFYDQALSVTVGIVISMLVSVLLLPPLFLMVHRMRPFGQQGKEYELPAFVSVTSWYEKAIHWAFDHKKIVFTMVILVIGAGVLAYLEMNKTRLPDISRKDIELRIDWNAFTPLDTSAKRIADILAPFADDLSVSNIWIGQQQYLLSELNELKDNEAIVYLSFKSSADLTKISSLLGKAIKTKYPDARYTQEAAPNAFDAVFADRDAPVVLQIGKEDSRKMPSLKSVESLQYQLNQQFPEAYIPPVAKQRILLLRTDVEMATRYGIQTEQIAQAISAQLKPLSAGQFQGSQSWVPIRIGIQTYETIQQLLANTTVKSSRGQVYPLDIFVKSRSTEDFHTITAGKQGEYYAMSVNGADPKLVIARVADQLDHRKSPFSVQFAGSYLSNQQLIEQMGFILIISILLLYFILAAQFESLLQPLFILAELPIAIMGAFILLYLGGNSINLMSMIGIVIMGGLVINDSILKIDAINRYRKQGMPLLNAIHEGGVRRLKPMVMISMTSIGALLPTLFMDDLGSELQKPLALALIGGMSIGLLVSLFFVPLLYWLVYRKKESKLENE